MSNESIRIEKVWNRNNIKDHEIKYILKDDRAIYGISTSKNDPDEILCTIDDELDGPCIEVVPNWDYSHDRYFFENLEKGKKIVYMPLEVHHLIWSEIGTSFYDIDHQEGLQKYLSYCQKHDITKDTINSLNFEKVDDAMKYYHELNGSYSIIGEFTVNNDTIVLGCSPKNPSPYVTWKTNPNRSNGYRSGHYLTNKKDAKMDFHDRCQELCTEHLDKIIEKQRNMSER